MARFTDWRVKRASAATNADIGDLQDVGSKLLAYLDNQRKLSGVQTISKTVQLPSGDRVQAAFFGDIPITTVHRVKTGGNVLANTFMGFVTSARSFADPTAFDDFPDIIITPSDVDEPDRRHYVHDGDGGKPYKHNSEGQELYYLSPDTPPTPPGLRINSFGYVDWRNGAEDATVNYAGPSNRYFAFNGQGLDVFVYHNGEVLLNNTTATADGGAVAGACISRDYLVWCTVQTGGFGGDLTYNLYRAKIKRGKRPFWVAEVVGTPVLLGPRYKAIEPADAELIYTAAIPDAEYQFYASNVFFNQSGTELRGLYYKTDTDALYARELTINFADWDDIGAADVQLASYSETTEVVRSYPTCRSNSIKHRFSITDAPDDFAGSEGLTPGSYTISSSSLATHWHERANTLIPARGTISDSFVNPWLLALEASYTRTVTPTLAGNFPVAVDYQDDRPVYAYLRVSSSSESCEYSGSMNYAGTYDEYRTFDFGLIFGGGVSAELDHIIETRHLDASSSSTYTKTGAGLGLWVPKTRPGDGVGNWLDAQLAYSDSGTTSSTSEGDFANEYAVGGSDSASWEADSTITTTEAVAVVVWWMDLRFDSAAFSTYRRSLEITDTRAYSDTFTFTAYEPNPFLQTLAGTRDATTTHARVCTTDVVMNREVVASCSGARPIADDTFTSSAALTDYDQAFFGLRALGFCEKEADLFDGKLGGLFDLSDARDAWEALYAGNPPFNKYGPMPYADYVVDTEADETTVPDRTVTNTHPASTPEYDTGDFVVGLCPGNWATEGNLHPGSDFDRVPGGAWIYMRADWAFSMAWLDGDTSTIQWHTVLRAQGLGGMQTLDTISGHAAESYAPMWPFAKALYSYRKSP